MSLESERIEELFEKAKNTYEHGFLEKCENFLLEILEKDPENIKASQALDRCRELKNEPNVMILREKRFPGCGSKIPLYVNDNLKYKLKNGEFIKFRLPIGRYMFEFSKDEGCKYNTEIKNDYHIIEINCYNSLTGVHIETHDRYMRHWFKDIFQK